MLLVVVAHIILFLSWPVSLSVGPLLNIFRQLGGNDTHLLLVFSVALLLQLYFES